MLDKNVEHEWSSLFEKQIQAVIYYIESIEVSAIKFVTLVVVFVKEFMFCKSLAEFIRLCQEEVGGLEGGFLILNHPNAEAHLSEQSTEDMDQIIQDNFLEFLSDDLATLTVEDKNSGSLLSSDEKKGIERLIESLQLFPWSSMERCARPKN